MNDDQTGRIPKKTQNEVNLGIPEAEYPELRPIIGGFLPEKGMNPADVEGTATPEKVVRHVQVMIPSHIANMMVKIANNAWKLRTRMTAGEDGKIKEDWMRLCRHVDAILANLGDVGMEVKDRTGEPFDYGLPEKVIASHPRPGTTKESVIETLKPTIYFNNQIIQTGEVVIATPEQGNPTTESEL